jgi:hypothetical protein
MVLATGCPRSHFDGEPLRFHDGLTHHPLPKALFAGREPPDEGLIGVRLAGNEPKD